MKPFCILITILIAACAPAPTKSPTENLNPTYATWVFADEKEDGDQIRKQYLDGAFPMAREAGMRELQGFAAKVTLMGDMTPEFVGLFTWPDALAARSVRESDRYLRDYGPLRPLGWDQFVAVDVELLVMPNWQFEADRYYTIALVWAKSDEAYQRYVSATAQLRQEMDFTILYSEPVLSWTQIGLDPKLRAPDRVSLLSWPDASVPDQYLKAISTQTYSTVVDETFEKVSWHEIVPYQ